MRAFLAIDVEDNEIVRKFVELEKKLLNTGALLKPVEPENFHITIKFLGEISEKEIPLIREIVIKHTKFFKPFEISFEGVGAFPSISYPRVIWVGIVKNREKLSNLASNISADLEKTGFHKESRGFHPHVTIARVKKPSSQLKKTINEFQGESFGQMVVRAIRLKKSVLTPQGPIYTTIFEVLLSEEK